MLLHSLRRCVIALVLTLSGLFITTSAHTQHNPRTPAIINDNDRYAFAMTKLALSYESEKIAVQADTGEEKNFNNMPFITQLFIT